MKCHTPILVLLVSLLLTSTPVAMADDEGGVDNVILLIGDGMGYEHMRLASLVEYGDNHSLFMQNPRFYRGNMTTNNSLGEITDSAASGTAIATGFKTEDKYLSLLPNGTAPQTILEYAKDLNLSTALVTTTTFNHATPAAFASHVESRNEYDEITDQMINQRVDLILGGGSNYPPSSELLSENNYTYITEKEDLATISSRTLGTFYPSHFEYEENIDLSQDVRLRDLTAALLDFMETNSRNFVMLESGRIDHAGHANDPVKGTLEILEFDYTVEMIYNWTLDHPDTLVIVTSDHETGGLSIESTALDANLPSGNEQQLRDMRVNRTNQITTSYSSDYHTDKVVPVMAFGKKADALFTFDKYDNTHIYHLLKAAIDGTNLTVLPPIPELIFPSAPTTPTFTSTQQSEAIAVGSGGFILLLALVHRRRRHL